MAFVLLLSFPNGSAQSVPFIITDGAGCVNAALASIPCLGYTESRIFIRPMGERRGNIGDGFGNRPHRRQETH